MKGLMINQKDKYINYVAGLGKRIGGLEIKRVVAWVGAVTLIALSLTACAYAERGVDGVTQTDVSTTDYFETFHMHSDITSLNITDSDCSKLFFTDQKDEGAKENAKASASIASREQLLAELDAELNKKWFSHVANDFFVRTLHQLYQHYPDWQNTYADMPRVDEYIRTNLIDVVAKINEIRCYEENSKEAQDLLAEGSAAGFTDSNFNITLIYTDPATANEDVQNHDIECFFHEVTHCNQNNIVFNYDFFNSDHQQLMFTEGGATFHQKFVTQLTPDHGGSWSVLNENASRILEYQKSNGTGYLLDLNAYENLVYLTGYNVIYGVEQGDAYNTIEKTIAQKYGMEKAINIMKTMDEWYNQYQKNWQGDKVYELSVQLQNLYLDCIKQDIQRLDVHNQEQIKTYMEIYRNYKMNNLAHVFDQDGNDITNQVFDIDALDELLIDKIIESNALEPFSSNTKLNRMAIKTLLFASNESYFEADGC